MSLLNLNLELSKIYQWFRSNQLSLHPGKIKFTIGIGMILTYILIIMNLTYNLFSDPNLIKKINYVNHENSTPAIKFLGIRPVEISPKYSISP